jgi:hypothetical protein
MRKNTMPASDSSQHAIISAIGCRALQADDPEGKLVTTLRQVVIPGKNGRGSAYSR